MTTSSPNFQSILDAALDNYHKQTGIDLTNHPSAEQLQNCHSPDDVVKLLLERESTFKNYRDKYRKLIDCLRPVVNVIHAFSAILVGVSGLVPFQPTNAIFTAIDILISTAISVSASYDALGDLFECVTNLLKRLQVYTEKIPSFPAMSDIMVKIMIEVFNVVALATEQIKNGRFKKFAKRLLGESDVEAILQRLDRLTQEEARMAGAHTLEVVHGLFDNLKVVLNDGKASMIAIQQALVSIQETADGINKLQRNQFQMHVRSWLTPPDPSINHNIARKDHLQGTASWFIQSDRYKEWTATGSLLWIHGKPGSGKSILCSSIIQQVERLRDTGLALIAYFYCDFRDRKKQEATGLLTSLCMQLSAKSDSCYNVLSALYFEYDGGSRRPDDDTLLGCLEKMLKIEGQPKIYIIIDALDECPTDSGVRSHREWVLDLVNKLVNLHLTNLRICATSRPEADIQAALASSAPHTISLHGEVGQNKDIADYVRSVVYSDWKMRRWREDDKEMVISTLSEKADGMFRWVSCQLEALRRSLPSVVRRALDHLPKSLDETYDRILQSIAQERQEFAQHLFQCLAESIRPLYVEEFADILAIEFETGAIAKYHVNWRPENPEEEVLTICSSLITIVDMDGSRVVRFSHFSVKEYLTSQRLMDAGKGLSDYHILSHSAHTILAKASLSVLLALDDLVNKDSMKNYPLAVYAARYWVEHAKLHDISSRIKDAMDRLFDPDKPHFAAWVWIHDIDYSFRETMFTKHPSPPTATPLYYATLCGFHDLVEHLIVAHPGDINARGGYHVTALHAAVIKGNVDIMRLLLEHGADVATLNNENFDPLYEASRRGRLDVIGLLLDHHADVNSRSVDESTRLIMASQEGELEVARVLLQHGADPNSREDSGWMPLMSASKYGHLDIVRLLLQNGATVDSHENDGLVSLMVASEAGHADIVRLLLQNGAPVDSCDNDSWTSLMFASQNGHVDAIRLLLQNGAAVDSHDNSGWTSLMFASQNGHVDVVRLLLQNGAPVNPCGNYSWTSLMLASRNGHLDVVDLLLQSGATVDSRNNEGCTSLMIASQNGRLNVVLLLLQNSAAVDSHDNNGWTSLKFASEGGHLDVVHLLLQNSAAVESRHHDRQILSGDSNPDGGHHYTALHLASAKGHSTIAELLIQYGADVNAQNYNQETPLHLASGHGQVKVTHLLLASGSDVNSRDSENSTPLHKATQSGHLDVVALLLESGADINARNTNDTISFDLASNYGRSDVARLLAERMGIMDSQLLPNVTHPHTAPQDSLPQVTQSSIGHGEGADSPERTTLHTASEAGDVETVRSLLDGGVDVNKRDANHQTPVFYASQSGMVEVAELLVKHGADVNSQDWAGRAPLHIASREGHLDVIQLLLDHGADVDAMMQDHWTALHFASKFGYFEIVEALLKQGANVEMRNDSGRTHQVASRYGERKIMRLLLEYDVHGM